MDTTEIELRARDESHIKLLAIFYFILAGFSTLGLLFIGMHYMIMHSVFTNPQIIAQMKEQSARQNQPMPFDPSTFFSIFLWFYVVFGLWSVVSIVLNVAAGFSLLKRRSRVFGIVVAGFNCLNIPLGTVLGVFTIVVLTRTSVRQRFLESPEAVSV